MAVDAGLAADPRAPAPLACAGARASGLPPARPIRRRQGSLRLRRCCCDARPRGADHAHWLAWQPDALAQRSHAPLADWLVGGRRALGVLVELSADSHLPPGGKRRARGRPTLRAAGAVAIRTACEALAAARAAPEEAARAVKVQQLVERELLARLVASEFGDSLTTSLEKSVGPLVATTGLTWLTGRRPRRCSQMQRPRSAWRCCARGRVLGPPMHGCNAARRGASSGAAERQQKIPSLTIMSARASSGRWRWRWGGHFIPRAASAWPLGAATMRMYMASCS